MAETSDDRDLAKEGQKEGGVALTAALAVDPWEMFATYQRLALQALMAPRAALDATVQFAQELGRIANGSSEVMPDAKDARFDQEALASNQLYRRLVQSYLAWCNSIDEWLPKSGLEGMEADRARFMMRIMKDVYAPQNTLVGNPAALRKATETKGESLVKGFRNYIDDLQHNHGYPAVANRHAFKVGVDVANTPGEVVYRTELFELIQYTPTTATVYPIPLVYVFSQVNRFYLGDLTSDRSMFRALLDAGIQIFALSWRNPEPEHRGWGLDTYADGVIRAIDAAKSIAAAKQVHLIGVCAGGVTAAVAAGVLSARQKKDIRSLSLFINILDNRPEDSDFGLWVSEQSVESQKTQTNNRGFFSEKQVFEMFAWLRPEDNVMSFLRSNYLLGEDPPSHPLLFWSMDYTRMPARLHGDFLDLSLHNSLVKGDYRALGVRVDLSRINYPVYLMAGSTDHITPWQGCYRSAHLFGERPEFVLTNQNHTQTISARADNKHLRYWINSALPAEAADWIKDAQEHRGSWRDHWIRWMQARSDTPIAAPQDLGNKKYQPLGPAPGLYIHQ